MLHTKNLLAKLEKLVTTEATVTVLVNALEANLNTQISGHVSLRNLSSTSSASILLPSIDDFRGILYQVSNSNWLTSWLYILKHVPAF